MNITPTRPHRAPTSEPPRATRPDAAEDAGLRPLLAFVAVALPTAWILLTVPLLTGLPAAPFILGSTLFALLLPALLLTRRYRGGVAVRSLLRDAVRWPRSPGWMLLLVLSIPVVTWVGASLLGGAEPVSAAVVGMLAVRVVLDAVVLNVWEELAWTGFAQRRAAARWGSTRGAVVVAVLFAAIHLPLAFYDAADAGDVAFGLLLLLVTGVGLRLLIAGADRWSGGSLLLVGLLHAAFNRTGDLVDPAHDWVRLLVTVVIGVLVAVALRADHATRERGMRGPR